MVEVFKTNVEAVEQTRLLIKQIAWHIPNGKINFDLQDCDKILRVEGEKFSVETIIDLMKQHGFNAEVLP